MDGISSFINIMMNLIPYISEFIYLSIRLWRLKVGHKYSIAV